MINQSHATQQRDDKVRKAMQGIAPLWMVKDEWRAEEECLLFDLAYQHSIYGFIQERYKYDAFNNVMYHFGWRKLDEEKALVIQETPVYIEGEVSTAAPVDPKPRGW